MMHGEKYASKLYTDYFGIGVYTAQVGTVLILCRLVSCYGPGVLTKWVIGNNFYRKKP